jgi:hypothetical protein
VLVWQMPGGFAGEDLHRVGHLRLGPLLRRRLGARAPRVEHATGPTTDVIARCASPRTRPDVVVLPAFREQLHGSLAAVPRLAAVAPDLPAILSGWGCEPEYLDALGAAVRVGGESVFFARGEPETALLDALCILFDGGGGLDSERRAAVTHAGLAARGSNGAWTSRGAFRRVDDLRALPSPLLAGRLPPAETGGAALIEVARGCLFRCGFCLSCNFDPAGVRAFPLPTIRAELAWARRHGATSVALLCSALNYDAAVLEGVADALERVDPRGEMPVESTIHAALLDERRLAATARIRWRRMIVGLQSTNPAALKVMGRAVHPPTFFDAVERLAEHHAPVVEIILGLPGDTPAGFRRTLDDVLALPAHVAVYRLRLDPGSHFLRDRSALGLVADFARHGVVRATPTFTEAEIDAAARHVESLGAGPWRFRARSLEFDFAAVHRPGPVG